MNMSEIPYTIYAEGTPNPASLKFVANKLILVSGASAEYDSVQSAKDAPIALALFQFPFVKRILINSNYITVLKSDSVSWDEVMSEVRIFITNYLNDGKEIVNKLPQQEVAKDNNFKETVKVNTQHAPPSNEVETKIIEILEQYIRPAVEQDGGMITFKQLQDGIVTVQMRGSCSGCPSSTQTLKAGIEGLLKRLMPDAIKEVVSEAM
ncbi:MAG: NifU family protein [Sphingobacteriaceae bacterium]|nr:NifU family protein [Sphingobacteriaceae bacterium]